MEYTEILTGDIEKFNSSIKNSFNISIDQIPIEILRRGRDAIAFYLSSFFRESLEETMKGVALKYLDICNIQVKKILK